MYQFAMPNEEHQGTEKNYEPLDCATLAAERRCVRCGVTYRERDNIGAWKCRFHPMDICVGDYGEKYGVGKYGCCGMSKCNMSPCSPSRVGCCASDHCDKVGSCGKSVSIKFGDVGRIPIYEESWAIVSGKGIFKVARYDKRTANLKQQTNGEYGSQGGASSADVNVVMDDGKKRKLLSILASKQKKPKKSETA